MAKHGNHASVVELDRHGITGASEVFWNLSVPVLVEHALRNSEGALADSGALVCTTGRHTGRSPNDKFLVQEAGTSSDIWWGKVNVPISEEHFDRLFVRHELPADIPEITIAVDGAGAPLSRLLRESGLAGSTSEGRRLVEQGGVSVDGERITDPTHLLPAGTTVVLQAGKRRFARVTLQG